MASLSPEKTLRGFPFAAVIYLNPALNSEEMLTELTRLFGLDELDFVRVKNDGSRHYRAYAP